MKLSDLVAYLTQLNRFDIGQVNPALAKQFEPLIHTVTNHEMQYSDISQCLHTINQEVRQCIYNFENTVNRLKQEILNNIESAEPQFFINSYRLYSENMVNDSNELMLSRRISISPETEQHIVARLVRHGDWHYPGMIIRPGVEKWIQHLVALDPLYLVDVNTEMLDPCVSQFNQEYQTRLRKYIIKESVSMPMLTALPQQQMALILAYNYFEFKPMELIEKLLLEVFNCLRPGGTFAFTFNNCDRHGAVDLAERFCMCYTPGRLLLNRARDIGYEVAYTFDVNAASTWVELQRPGKLTNIRGGQSLAKIIAKGNKT
jgi:hypothetical protein